MITKISIFVLIVLSIYVYLGKKDIFSPSILYVYIWGGTIGISSLYLSGLQQQWNIKFILILILNIFFFILGTKCIRSSDTSEVSSKIKVNLESFKNKYNESKIFKVLIVLFVLSLISYVVTIIKLGPPPIFKSSVIKRSDYYVPYVELIFLNILIFMNLSYIYVLVYKKNKLILILFNIIAFLMLLSKTNKYQLFIVMFLYLSAYNLFKNRIGIKKVLSAVLVVLLVFVSLYKYIYADNIISLDTRVKVNQFKLEDNLSVLVDPYIYVSMNLENLNNFTQQNIQHTYGLQTFSGMLSLVKLDTIIQRGYNLKDEWTNNLQYPWLNTGSYLYFFYWDFGFVGLMIGPFLFGLISEYLYRKISSGEESLFSIFMYQYFMFAIILSFFTLIFVQLPIIINLISVYFIEKYFKKRKIEGI